MNSPCAGKLSELGLTIERAIEELLEIDPDAILRIETIFYKLRIRNKVENFIKREDEPKH